MAILEMIIFEIDHTELGSTAVLGLIQDSYEMRRQRIGLSGKHTKFTPKEEADSQNKG